MQPYKRRRKKKKIDPTKESKMLFIFYSEKASTEQNKTIIIWRLSLAGILYMHIWQRGLHKASVGRHAASACIGKP